jgi:hypothetical protein
MKAHELAAALNQFTGTEDWHYHPMYKKMLYTDGVKFFIHNAGGGAFWLLDIIGTEIFPLHERGEEFIVITLEVKDHEALISANDGGKDGRKEKDVMTPKHITYTDCPEGTWTLYLENSVLCLPGER